MLLLMLFNVVAVVVNVIVVDVSVDVLNEEITL